MNEVKIVRKEGLEKVKKDPMVIFPYKINPNFSATYIEIDGNYGAIKCLREDRIYFIIEGSGKFIIEDNEYEVKNGDLIFIPMNTPYNIIGKMSCFLLCSPEFNPDDDVWL
ncbi:MAG: cupin domain-containing protein [archaeon]|nr:MAG: cupin domain-containing protein [archaeon]